MELRSTAGRKPLGLIAGGGVAALEALLAPHELAGDRIALERQRLAQQGVVEQVDLPDREVVGRAPVGVQRVADRRRRAAPRAQAW